MTILYAGDDLLDKLRPVVADVVRRNAVVSDREGRFPAESFSELGALGLLGYFIPAEFGGLGGDLKTYAKIAAMLGEECLSTAIIWAMHCQQVDVLVNRGFEEREQVLREIAAAPSLVASVTTEYQKGGNLLKASAPIRKENDRLRIVRESPVVSYPRRAEFFLVTMQSLQNPNFPMLVLVRRGDGNVVVNGASDMLGMRGTENCSMSFDVTVAPHRIVADPFRQLAVRTMIPVGHIGWAAAWFGAARGAYHRVLVRLRQLGATKEKKLDSELLRHRLADVRVSLDMVEALLDSVTARLEEMRSRNAPQAEYENITFNIAVNNLKIAASRTAFSVVNELIEVCGFFHGYVEDETLGLGRVFRDLRSASLMYHNDRLLDANGSLIFIENSRLQMLWKNI